MLLAKKRLAGNAPPPSWKNASNVEWEWRKLLCAKDRWRLVRENKLRERSPPSPTAYRRKKSERRDGTKTGGSWMVLTVLSEGKRGHYFPSLGTRSWLSNPINKVKKNVIFCSPRYRSRAYGISSEPEAILPHVSRVVQSSRMKKRSL